MNGRLYDPLLRRFLNADENIQDPENTQIYNKYGYVANNPLLFNDPSGEIFGIDDIVISALIIGAMIGAASYTLAILVNTGSLRQWNVFDFGKSIIIGGISGAATAGIGNMFESAHGAFQSLTGAAKYLTQGGMHGLSQGFFAIVDGNGSGFFQGFISGALGSLAASGWASAIGKVGAANGGMIAFGALSGGIGAELSGGNFFKGFLQGGIVSGLNHSVHEIYPPSQQKQDVDLDKVMSHYPGDENNQISSTDAYTQTGGSVEKFYNDYVAGHPGEAPNACALRLSMAFNDAGYDLKYVKNVTFKGGNGKNYFLSSEQMAANLPKQFNISVAASSSSATLSNLISLRGIYHMIPKYPSKFGATGHITLWNGSTCLGGHCYNDHPQFYKATLYK